MRLTPATNEAIRYACLHYHYAKAVPVNTVAYNVYNDSDEWCGVILFARGANDRIGSEYGLLQGQILELVRVALNGKQESTSQAVAMCLKQLRKDCPLCRMVVSYADCDQNHLGTIYQATNWIYVGTSMENQQDSSWIVNGKRRHGRIISGWVKQRGGAEWTNSRAVHQEVLRPQRDEIYHERQAQISLSIRQADEAQGRAVAQAISERSRMGEARQRIIQERTQQR